jgi:glucose/arabinose dehydrogenase
MRATLVTLVLTAGLVGCAAASDLPPNVGYGPTPLLPAPEKSLIPTVDVAPAVGWPSGKTPVAASGLQVKAFAAGFQHPRWLYVLPNGDVLVAESAAPGTDKTGGIKGWFMGLFMKKAGSAVPSANRITLLRDADGDGTPEVRETFLEGLHSPFGMALVGDTLFVANCDAILRFPYTAGMTRITASGAKFADLPGLPFNHHWTKNIIASADGAKLYATVGSNSNIGENGMDVEEGRAAIWEFDIASGKGRIFATGLRNPNGMDWEPVTGKLFTVVNERDELGHDLVPDYLTSVRDGGFYGWPYSYYGQHVDERIKPQRPDLVAKAIVPDYGLGAHTASLGLAFYNGTVLPEHYRGGAFIGQHGSWNRKPQSGYKVVFVGFTNGMPTQPPEDVLTGFLDAEGRALGRPVGVVVDAKGALLVADDVGNTVWRIIPAS